MVWMQLCKREHNRRDRDGRRRSRIQCLLNKSFSSTYNFSVEFSKTFSKTAQLIL